MDSVSHKEFKEFKEEFNNKLDAISERLDKHIENQKKRDKLILEYLESDSFKNLKLKLKKYHESIN